ncbi:cupin domain-containing protein [Candidatus Pacearchaeota archaeon]|nr:cupin domain-containing protein [Candidatus Pacearchaeota archaeon]
MTVQLSPDLLEIVSKIRDGEPYIVNKPWGREEWLALNEEYCYKRIYLKKGHSTSIQYHQYKSETNYISEGEAEVSLEDLKDKIEMSQRGPEFFVQREKSIHGPGYYFNVRPPRWHRVTALTDLVLMEVSTPHVMDVVRLKDEWGRGNGHIEREHQK